MKSGAMLSLVVLISAFCWCVYGAVGLARGNQTHRRWNATFGGWFIGCLSSGLLEQHLREQRLGYSDTHIVDLISVMVLSFLILVGSGSAFAYVCALSHKRRKERRRLSPP